MDIDDYLQRINGITLRKNSVQNLYKLQNNHLLNVPYENLDIHLYYDYNFEFDREKIYDKIVKNKRGGLSFELNYLFYWLLNELGYDVHFINCRNYKSETDTWMQWGSHIALIVNMNDSKFLVDVGSIDNYRTPLKFAISTIQFDITGQYNIINCDELINTFILLKCTTKSYQNENDWIPVYKFSLQPIQFNDLANTFRCFKKIKDGFLSNRSICAIHTESSIIKLVGYELSEIKFANSTEKSRTNSPLTKSEVYDAIQNIYGLRIETNKLEPINNSIS